MLRMKITFSYNSSHQTEKTICQIYYLLKYINLCQRYPHLGATSSVALRTVPTNKEVFWGWLMTMRGKQILARAIEIQKENWG